MRNQRVVQVSKYSKRQSDFKHKSVIRRAEIEFYPEKLKNCLRIFNMKRHLEMGQMWVTRSKFVSSDRWRSFQKSFI